MPQTQTLAPPTYWSQKVGHRFVPVELGKKQKSLMSFDEKLMTFATFLEDYWQAPILTRPNPRTAYIAQHSLFNQIPSLRQDLAFEMQKLRQIFIRSERRDEVSEDEVAANIEESIWMGTERTLNKRESIVQN